MSSTQNQIEVWLSEEEARTWMTDKAGNHVYEMSFCQKETPTYGRRATIIFHPKVEAEDMHLKLEN